MRTFVILCSVVSAAYAASLGYNYDINGAGVGGGQIAGGVQNLGSSGANYGSSAYGGGSVGGFSVGGQGVGGSGYSTPTVSFGSGVGGGSIGGGSIGGGSIGGGSIGGGSIGGGSIGGGLIGGGSIGGGSIGGGSIGGGSIGGGSIGGGSGYSGPGISFGNGVGGGSIGGGSVGGISVGAGGPSYSAPAETVKEFFTYTAPEHEFSDIGDSSQIANSLKKNLRVIFIKGPENNGLEQAAVQLAKSAVNEQTAIYVLSKQADVASLANKLQSVGSINSNKPEVHFIKYKTPADAEHAQHTIQSQYDSLSGPSSTHNGGTAPVLNFVSNPAPATVDQGYSAGPVGNAEAAYLPPSKRA